MTDSESTPNPYAPSAIVEESDEYEQWDRSLIPDPNSSESDSPRLSLRRTALRWLIVCTISAIPSFVYGLLVTNGQIGGMLVGILIFVAGYTVLDYRTATHPWREGKRVRRTLRIAYGTRIAISILFPIGGFLDVICGFATISIISPITDLRPEQEPLGFFVALLTTLVQGCVLNVVLAIYAGLVHLIQIAVSALRGRGSGGQR